MRLKYRWHNFLLPVSHYNHNKHKITFWASCSQIMLLQLMHCKYFQYMFCALQDCVLVMERTKHNSSPQGLKDSFDKEICGYLNEQVHTVAEYCMLLDVVCSLNQLKQTRLCLCRYFSHCAMILRQTWDCTSIHIFSWMTGIHFVWESWILLLFSGWSLYGSSIGTLTSKVMIENGFVMSLAEMPHWML
jgi:hypothetical protein